MNRRCAGNGLLLAGTIVTVVGLGVALTVTLGIPRHWTAGRRGPGVAGRRPGTRGRSARATSPDTIASMPSAERPHAIYTRAYWLRVAVVGLTAAVLLTALFTILGRTTAVPVMLKHSLVHSSIMAGLCGALLPGIRRRIAQASSWLQWAVTIPSLLGLAAMGTALACGLIALTGAHEAFWPAFTFALPINALITMTLGVGMSLYEAQRVRLDAVTLELRTRELEAERDRKLALQARLASLESRLQPHFLFNTLNAITSLIQDEPDQAERMVERLAAPAPLLLDASERGLVPLTDELKIVADYLEIERARLGERLSFTLDVDADAAGREVPRWRSRRWWRTA